MKASSPHLSCMRWLAALTIAFLAALTMTAQTTQFAGGLGTPAGGAVLAGSAINPATGQPFRHLWFTDNLNGLCRLDPDVDTQTAHSINSATCINIVGGVQFNAGAMAFDSTTNDLYVADGGGKFGILRFHFVPSGDSGHGSIDTTREEVLGGSISGGKLVGGCNIGLNQPSGIALGPDGNLYVGFRRVGTLMRIVAPQTEPLPCGNVQADIGSTADAKRDVALTFVGSTLDGVDGRTDFEIPRATQCFTAQNGFLPCSPGALFATIGAPSAAASDQLYPAANGNKLYTGNLTAVYMYDQTQGTIQAINGTAFSNVSAIAVEVPSSGPEIVYAGDDPSAGLVPGQGRWWQVVMPAPVLAPPASPFNVQAIAGNAQATVSWNPQLNGQPTTSYVVRNTFASTGALVPDVTVTAPAGSTVVPTSVIVTGLVNGTGYQFAVQASNSAGSSLFSFPSNVVTPQAPTVPGAPGAVVASAANASAQVAWTAPANGGSPITSYTVTVLANGIATGATVAVPGSSTGALVGGLTNGTSYSFTVHATNALGNGAESLPSNAVIPIAITAPDAPTAVSAVAGNNSAAVSWSAPVNNGGAPISGYTVYALIGGVPSASLAVGNVNAATFSGLVNGTTYTFAVTASNSAGTSPLSLPSNAVVPAAPPTTTDIQVTGAAQNGGPSVTGTDTFTWQIKNNQSAVANQVSFSSSLAPQMVFQSVSSNAGACSGPAPGTAGGVISCALSNLAGGQTLVVTVNVTFSSTGTMSTAGQASFNGTDTNLNNNAFTVTIGVK